MRIDLVIPPSHRVGTGNRQTAEQWAAIFEELGHEAAIWEGADERGGDVLVALHAVKCREAIVDYRRRMPEGKLVVSLTGTDLYGEECEELAASMREADRLVVLQEKALEQVPAEFRDKCRVIVQGVRGEIGVRSEREGEEFTVCVVGHLREVKDPLRAAQAARLLPESSRIRVVQAGAIVEEGYGDLVATEEAENPRYRWLGEVSGREVRALLARSDVMVISSRSEGGARIVGEAVTAGTPILASRIEGTVGLLGEDYPGYFPVGDTEALARLLAKVEADESFRKALKRGIERVVEKFDPERERRAWGELLGELGIG